MFIFLMVGEKAYADGRLVLPTLEWQASDSSINFHSINSYTLVSDDEEYAITLDPKGDHWIGNTRLIGMKISLGSRNGFSSFKQVDYAFVPIQFSVSRGETIYASFDSNHQIILSSTKGLTDYMNGPYPLTHVKRESKLNLVNESQMNLASEQIFINNGSKVSMSSNQNTYTLLFEDMGWNTFKPEAQDLAPQRRIKVWLETQSLLDPSEQYKRLYAVIEYSHLDFPMTDNGSYFVDLPIEILIDQDNQLHLTVEADVTYPYGAVSLN